MNTPTFIEPKTTRTTKIPGVLPPADFERRIRRSIALRREYNAELRELLDLQTQLMALGSLRRRAAANANPGLFRVPDVN